MKNLLRWKHWQLFIPITGLPILLNFVFLGVGVSIAVNNPQNPEAFFSMFKFFPFIVLPSILILFGWFWSIGVELSKYIPEDLRLNVKLFKFFLLFPFFYFIGIFILMFMMFSNMPEMIESNTPPPFLESASFPLLIILFFFMHLFSIFCMFYCIYFTARTYKTALLQRKLGASDYIGEFFLIWFNFIGVWILQPKINNIVAGNNTNKDLLDN